MAYLEATRPETEIRSNRSAAEHTAQHTAEIRPEQQLLSDYVAGWGSVLDMGVMFGVRVCLFFV